MYMYGAFTREATEEFAMIVVPTRIQFELDLALQRGRQGSLRGIRDILADVLVAYQFEAEPKPQPADGSRSFGKPTD